MKEYSNSELFFDLYHENSKAQKSKSFNSENVYDKNIQSVCSSKYIFLVLIKYRR